jgi:hypothetical protein
MTAPTLDEMQAYLKQRRLEVEDSMRGHMGDQTMCELHKDGSVSGGLKYDEGRLVALGDALRAARKAEPGLTPAALRLLLEGEQAKWQAQLARYLGQERRSMPWIAYSQGGVDMYAEMLLRLG